MSHTLITIKKKSISDQMKQQICSLKNSHWNYGLKEQLYWFDKNINNQDDHNIIMINGKVAGYTCLREKEFLHSNEKYLLFDTFIIEIQSRGIGLARIMMEYNNIKIRESKKVSILYCNKKLLKFYTKFEWQVYEKKNNIEIIKNKINLYYDMK
jgi:predicted acetyltransferase